MFFSNTHNFIVKFSFMLLLGGFSVVTGHAALAQVNGSLPVATTVELAGEVESVGEVVVYDELLEIYRVSEVTNEPGAFGVTAVDPALVFVTDTNAFPVVTSGVTSVLVNTDGGSIRRGDLLTTSAESGVATKALPENDHVFAMALENFEAAAGQAGSILAEVNRERAIALLMERRTIEEEVAEAAAEAEAAAASTGVDGEGESNPFTILRDGDVMGAIKAASPYIRGIIATVIAVGALFFVLYAFRSNIANATLSVGRNPRARNAIMAVSFGNLLFAIVLGLLAIFVAIAVLVLPV